tara:strand:+ start:328 stop:735 length:408 start_codon:yes stop_codon:yes gene_type:complete
MSTLRTNALEGVDAKNSITIVAGAGNITTTNVQKGLAKAFINFDGSGTVSIRDSFGVSSLADDGTGAYTVTLSITMSTATDWSGAMSGNGAGYSHAFGGTSGAFTATTFPVAVRTGDNANADINLAVGQVFGDLA